MTSTGSDGHALPAVAPTPTEPTRLQRRLPGPDVVRGVALIGVVVLNYHGYLILRGGPRGDSAVAEFFDPWTGPLATRFAATFVLVAGVSVTLLTRKTRHDPHLVAEMRWRLVRRGALLYIVGIWIDTVWAGTIIPYYGAMFALAALLFTLRSRWIAAVGIGAAAAGWLLRAWRYDRVLDGDDVSWLFAPDPGSLDDYGFGILVNGTHPLVPWLAFLCAGMLLGRVLHSQWWRSVAFAAGFVLWGLALSLEASAATPFQRVVLSTDPLERGITYTSSALGTALIAYAALDWIAERAPRLTDPLRRTGQLTLTLYLGHVAVFILIVRAWGLIEPTGLDVALSFAVAYWIVAIAAAVWWSKRYGRGPAESVYRSFGG